MAINIQKHQDAMVKAWKDVLDDKSSTDWALFGYEGQTNDLRLVGTGSGGLEELTEEFNSAKVMYAFLKVSDPQTSLNKYVLINWQGEGAQVVRKGTCVNHIRDVERLLHGAHATINARTEEDIEEARVIKVVSTGSRYDFKGPRSAAEQRGPIGSNYQRVIPGKEINSRERDTFWQKEEAEEKARTFADMQRKQAENLRLETERMSREQKELQQREQKIQEREHVINAAHKAELSRAPPPVAQSEKNLEVTPPRVTAEELRRQRTQEAKQLIGQRTIANSKAVFEQHSSASQMHVHKSNPAPVKPVRNSVTQRINAITQQTENSQVEPKQTNPEYNQVLNNARTEQVNNSTAVTTVDKQTIDDHNNKTKDTVNDHKEIINISKTNEVIKSTYQEKLHYDQNDDLDTNDYDVAELNEEQYSTIKRSPHSKSVESNLVNAGEDVETSKKEVITEQNHQFIKEDSNQTLVDAYAIYEDMADPGLQARALYDYQAADESEITFDPGDLITHIDCIDEGWWQGLGPDGTFGLFPANYVELIHIQ